MDGKGLPQSWGRRFRGTCNITRLAQKTGPKRPNAPTRFLQVAQNTATRYLPALAFARFGYFCKFLAFACQPCTRPGPITWVRHQTGAHRIVFHIANEAVQFHVIPHTMIKGFVLPENLSRPAQDRSGWLV